MPKSSNDIINNQPTRIVILGSGYAGVHAARRLIEESHKEDNIEVVLLSDTDHLLYVTMIYEVVAGNLAPSSIRQSIRTTFASEQVVFLQGVVMAVDFDNQTINYTPSNARSEEDLSVRDLSLSYDYLISAIGSETEFFGTPGADKYAHSVKRLPDATRLKNTLINNFEAAALLQNEDKQRELLSVVIVGGGPTGVTLAAKIADLLNDELADAFPRLIHLAEITVLEASDRLLGNLGSWFSNEALEALEKKGCVSVHTGQRVEEVRPDGVLCGGEFMSSRYVIWTAGVRAREFAITAQKSVEIDERSRRIHVTEELHTPSYPNIFVAGDQSWVDRPNSSPYPMRAQFAVRQGQQAANNILHKIRGGQPEKFFWADKGVVVSLGEGVTLAQIGGFHFSGPIATLAYKMIYLLSTVGARAKLRAILEWVMNLFLPRDVSEL